MYDGYRLEFQGDVTDVAHVDVYVYCIIPDTNAAAAVADQRGADSGKATIAY